MPNAKNFEEAFHTLINTETNLPRKLETRFPLEVIQNYRKSKQFIQHIQLAVINFREHQDMFPIFKEILHWYDYYSSYPNTFNFSQEILSLYKELIEDFSFWKLQSFANIDNLINVDELLPKKLEALFSEENIQKYGKLRQYKTQVQEATKCFCETFDAAPMLKEIYCIYEYYSDFVCTRDFAKFVFEFYLILAQEFKLFIFQQKKNNLNHTKILIVV